MERNIAMAHASRAVVELVDAAQRGMAKAYDRDRVAILDMASEQAVRPAQIGAALRLAPSSVTRHVRALEDAGQVLVRQDDHDRRTCLIETSPAGRTELSRTRTTGAEVFAQVTADWSVADIARLAELTDRLREDWARLGTSARRTAPRSPAPRWRRPTTPSDTDKPETDEEVS